MGLIKDIIDKIKQSRTIDLTFVSSVPLDAAEDKWFGEAIARDSCYVELYLESLRLAEARRFGTKFHAIAYSFVTLAREGDENAQLAAVSKPEKLAELDKNSLDRVITISKRMMAATPFRGGTISLELGLFSVKSGNLLSPILDYVTRVSSTAGISYVGTVKPFLPLITEGMDMIAGQTNQTELEVGVETDLNLDSGNVMAIISLPKTKIDVSKLCLDKDRKLLLDGKPLECGYAVFSVRPTKEKSDYGEIPELKERYAAFQSAIKKGNKMETKDALTAFRLAVIASADLIPSDADRLIEKAEIKYKKAFPPGGFADYRTKDLRVESLSEIGLYDK